MRYDFSKLTSILPTAIPTTAPLTGQSVKMVQPYDPLMPNLNDRSRNESAQYFRGRKPDSKYCTATDYHLLGKQKQKNHAARNLRMGENGTVSDGATALLEPYENASLGAVGGLRLDDSEPRTTISPLRQRLLLPYVAIPGVLQQPTTDVDIFLSSAERGRGSKRRRFCATSSHSGFIKTSRIELVRGSTVQYILDYATELYASPEQILDEMQENTFEEVMKLGWNPQDVAAVLEEAHKQGWDEEIQLQFDVGLGEIEFLAGASVLWHKQEDLDHWGKAEPIDARVAGYDVQGWWTRMESSENRHWEIWRDTSIGHSRR